MVHYNRPFMSQYSWIILLKHQPCTQISLSVSLSLLTGSVYLSTEPFYITRSDTDTQLAKKFLIVDTASPSVVLCLVQKPAKQEQLKLHHTLEEFMHCKTVILSGHTLGSGHLTVADMFAPVFCAVPWVKLSLSAPCLQ